MDSLGTQHALLFVGSARPQKIGPNHPGRHGVAGKEEVDCLLLHAVGEGRSAGIPGGRVSDSLDGFVKVVGSLVPPQVFFKPGLQIGKVDFTDFGLEVRPPLGNVLNREVESWLDSACFYFRCGSREQADQQNQETSQF